MINKLIKFYEPRRDTTEYSVGTFANLNVLG
jgi:hypothetical protein